METVLVTGVSGHVGWHLAGRVSNGGFVVRALVRTDEQAQRASEQGWIPVRGDLTDPPTLSRALEGVDLVVHNAAYLGEQAPLARSVNVEGTREMAERSLAAGVRRFVHISTVAVYGESRPPVVAEESPLATNDPDPYAATKALAEVELLRVRARGLAAIILRPGIVTHWSRSQWGDGEVERIRAKGWPEWLHPDDVLPWVHSENLAEMVWLALTHPAAPDDVFNAVDRNVTALACYGEVAAVLGRPVSAPKRNPYASRVRVGKIGAKLGYLPIHSFDETVARLVELARAVRSTTDR